jgi:flagellar protein FlaG
MSIQVPPAGSQDPAAPAAVPARPQPQPVEPAQRKVEVVPAVTVDALPSRPPLEVLEEMEAAARRYDELLSQQRELHFKHDADLNRVVVEVRDLDGNVLRTIPPSKALDVIAGGDLE